MILMVSSTIQERFKEFQRRKEESILKYKDRIQIVIYGAYNPPNKGNHMGEKKRLEILKDRLKKAVFDCQIFIHATLYYSPLTFY